MTRLFRSFLLSLVLAASGAAIAAESTEPVDRDETATAAEQEQEPEHNIDIKLPPSGNVVVNVWGEARLAANHVADGVIAIFGDAHVEGEVVDAVVTIFGNSYVAETGKVHDGVVSLFGNTYIDGEVKEAAVAVFGDLELGPNARVEGDIAVVAGKLTRDPGAVVSGSSEIVGSDFPALESVRTWIHKCLFYGRPLAFDASLWWAWAIAFGFLLFYVVVALMFDRSVVRCVETLETQPGQSTVASLMTVILVPVLFVLLAVSVIGIVVIPFVGMGLFVASLFGKAVALAALGRRVTRFTGVAPLGHIAFATFVGGLIAMGLYVIPVVGLIAYKLLGIIGLGVVVYTILLSMRQRSANRAAVAAAVATAAPVASAAPFAAGSAEPSPSPSQESAPSPAPAPAPAVPVDTSAPRAGFWIRMGALLIDMILIAVIIAILDAGGEFWLIVLAAYGALMWKLKGTTIGGLVCGLKVVRRDGAELNWDTAIVRALGCFLSMVVVGLGFLWIVFDEDRQAWHDKIAGTLVVRTTRPESLV
jgi:uncharacterized RDD family membrane protein YckC/cytoskeletal protein CcmA (bactofilin family)